MHRVSSQTRIDEPSLDRAVEQLRDYVKREGLKASEAREAVARAALELEGHFRVEALIESLPTLHYSTVYRVLPVLIEAGLIQAAPGHGDGQCYERAFEREPHDHLLCTSCGKVVEFHAHAMTLLKREIALRFDFAPDSQLFYMYGRCPDCQPRPAASDARG